MGDVNEQGKEEEKVKTFSKTVLTHAHPQTSLEYEFLTPECLYEEQETVIKNVCDVLDTSYDISNLLLLHFKWNKERLFDSYYSDPDGSKRKAGAFARNPGGEFGTGKDEILCQILYFDVPRDETFSMGCCSEGGCVHEFSIAAWHGYLCNKVSEGADAIFSTCPAEACHAVVSPTAWKKVLSRNLPDSDNALLNETLLKYQGFLAKSFVDINKTIRWCPGQGCDSAVKASGSVLEVKCNKCSSLFCFKCGLEAHAPVSCSSLSLWMEKCQNESETANWILANTKKCPKCSTRIEKNQGCNHMSCKVCKYDFCWICMGEWKDHSATTGGYYNCNKYSKTAEVASGDPEKDRASRAKQELDRYLHYYKRYAEHEQAGKFAAKQRQVAESRMIEMQSSSCVTWVDVQFIEQAVEQLIDCRRVLKYTYAFAYYLPSGPQKDLFEYNQSMLESHTEKLSELTEMSIDDVKSKRSEVINFTRVTGKFLKSLLEEVESQGMNNFIATNTPADPVVVPAAGSKKKRK